MPALFTKTPEELMLIRMCHRTPLKATKRWSRDRYIGVHVKIGEPAQEIANILTLPVQITSLIFFVPFVRPLSLLILWFFSIFWVILLHLITLPLFVLASLIILYDDIERQKAVSREW